MNFCAVHLKLTQYCKSIKKTILQLKKKLLQRRFLEQQQQIQVSKQSWVYFDTTCCQHPQYFNN